MNREQQRWYAKGYSAADRRNGALKREIEAVRRSASWVLASIVEHSGLTHDQIIDAGLAKAKAERTAHGHD